MRLSSAISLIWMIHGRLWKKSMTSAHKKEKNAMPTWPNGDSEGTTATCVSGAGPYYAGGVVVYMKSEKIAENKCFWCAHCPR